jgi:hypothetical protein
MAEEVNINIRISSNLDSTAAKASKSIDEVTKSADDASKSIEKTGTVTGKATQLIDKFTGGLATKIQSIGKYSKELGSGLVTAFKAGIAGASGLQKALLATGIGALVVALGAIVAYWDDIVEFISGASAEQTKLLASAEKTAQAQQDALDAISLQENSLRLIGKSEKEIRDLKIQQTNEAIKALEAQLLVQEQIKKSQEDSSKRNKQILIDSIKAVAVPLTMLVQTVDKISSALGKDFGLEKSFKVTLDSFAEGVGGMVFDQSDEVKAEGEATIKETKNQLAKLKSARDGYLLTEKNENAAAAKQRIEDAKKVAEEIRKIEEETQAFRAEAFIAAGNDEKAREDRRYGVRINQLKLQQKQEVAAAKDNAELIKAINEKYNQLNLQEERNHTANLEKVEQDRLDKLTTIAQRIDDIDASLIQDAQARDLRQLEIKYQREQAAAKGNYDLLEALNNEYIANKLKIENDYAKQASELRRATVNAELDVVKGAFDAIGQIAGEQSVLGKASAVASAVINTYQAATNALANTPAPPPFPQIAAGVAIASGLASVRKILQTPVPDGNGGLSSGGGGSLPSASTIQQPQFNIVGQSGTNQLAQSIGGQFSQPIRAYVVGGDVTTSQQLERQRVKTATFG